MELEKREVDANDLTSFTQRLLTRYTEQLVKEKPALEAGVMQDFQNQFYGKVSAEIIQKMQPNGGAFYLD